MRLNEESYQYMDQLSGSLVDTMFFLIRAMDRAAEYLEPYHYDVYFRTYDAVRDCLIRTVREVEEMFTARMRETVEDVLRTVGAGGSAERELKNWLEPRCTKFATCTQNAARLRTLSGAPTDNPQVAVGDAPVYRLYDALCVQVETLEDMDISEIPVDAYAEQSVAGAYNMAVTILRDFTDAAVRVLREQGFTITQRSKVTVGRSDSQGMPGIGPGKLFGGRLSMPGFKPGAVRRPALKEAQKPLTLTRVKEKTDLVSKIADLGKSVTSIAAGNLAGMLTASAAVAGLGKTVFDKWKARADVNAELSRGDPEKAEMADRGQEAMSAVNTIFGLTDKLGSMTKGVFGISDPELSATSSFIGLIAIAVAGKSDDESVSKRLKTAGDVAKVVTKGISLFTKSTGPVSLAMNALSFGIAATKAVCLFSANTTRKAADRLGVEKIDRTNIARFRSQLSLREKAAVIIADAEREYDDYLMWEKDPVARRTSGTAPPHLGLKKIAHFLTIADSVWSAVGSLKSIKGNIAGIPY